MGKSLISTLKRAGYFGAAGALILTTIPVIPISNSAWADSTDPFCVEGGDCYATLQEAFNTAPTNGTATRVYLNSSESVVQDGGAVLSAGQNVTFDLKGKAYDISGNTVGSSGTETLAFQLLKDSTFALKNGTITASSESAKIWIQNYANTTLDNVILDASNYPQTMYVVSNNCGSLTAKGNTQIIANSNGVAFDLWYGMNAIYDDGITVTFGDDFTGRVEGKVEYGAAVRARSTAGWQDKAKLDIKSGTFDVTFAEGSAGALTGANINVSGSVVGGNFTDFPTNIDVDKVIYKNTDGTYSVSAAPSLGSLKNKWVLAEVNDAMEIPITDDFVKKHSNFVTNYPSRSIIANGTFTALEPIYYTLDIKPEVYKKDSVGNLVRDEQYDVRMRICAYKVTAIDDMVLSAGSEETVPAETVKVAPNSSFSYSTRNTAIATVDANGKVTANGSGSTELYATISTSDESREVHIGTVDVYDFSSIKDTYLIKNGQKINIATDAAWAVNATTTATGVVNLMPKTNKYTIEGIDTGLAKVDFKATIGGEDISKSTNVYVYDVTGTDVIIKKGETATADEISQLIVKGHDDVSLRVRAIDDTTIVTNDGLALKSAADGSAGKAVVTYRLKVGNRNKDIDLNAHVWKMTSTISDSYDLGATGGLETDTFSVDDENTETDGAGERLAQISYSVKDASGNDTTKVRVEPTNSSNNYKIVADGDAPAGAYTVTFTDNFMGNTDSMTATVYVHEITTDVADENYIVMTRNPFASDENKLQVNANELSGSSESTINVTISGGVGLSYIRNTNQFTFTAGAAGAYTVTFSDTYASKSIKIYVLQFTFGQDSYDVARGSEGFLINAINNYWHDVNKNSGYIDTRFIKLDNGRVVQSGFDVDKKETAISADGEDYKFSLCRGWDCLPAGDYAVVFEAYANGGSGNGGKTATKQVRLHVYEMVKPDYDTLEINTYQGTNVDVYDLNSRGTVRAEVVSGDANAVEFETSGSGPFSTTDYTKFRVYKAGEYTIRYTDYMRNGDVAGTYELKLKVTYNIVADHVTDPEGVTAATLEAYLDNLADEGLADDLIKSRNGNRVRRIAERDDSKALFGENESYDTLMNLREALRTGVQINIAVDKYKYTQEEVAGWGEDKLVDLVKTVGADGVEYYDISILIVSDGNYIGRLHQLDDEITVYVQDLEAPADSYTRQYIVVREHEGENPEILVEGTDWFTESNKLYIKSSKFSTYAVAYVDSLSPEEPEEDPESSSSNAGSPNTGVVTGEENSVASLWTSILATLAVITLAGAVKLAMRKK